MPRSIGGMALAERFRMSRLRRDSALRRDARGAQAVPMQRLPQANFGARRDDFRFE
jgi:hypothetical protein